MTAVPWRTDAVAFLPSLLRRWNGSDIADDFMAWDNWKAIAEATEANYLVRVTNAAGQDFDQDLGVWISAVVYRGVAVPHFSISR